MIRMNNRPQSGPWPGILSLWALLSLIVGLHACAPLTAPREKISLSQANRVWKLFQQDFPSREDVPFWIKASLNYSGPEESRRSILELWGNTSLPLRLDLKAGLGITVSLWRIDTHGLLAYYPDQKAAYTHPDSGFALERLGFPSPFSLQELAYILTGQAAACLPPSFEQAIPQSNEHIEYRFIGSSRVQSLVLDQRGQMISMAGNQPYSWTINISDYHEDSQFLVARTYRLETAQHKAVVRIKDIRFRSQPWPEKALTLPLPDGTALRPMGK